MQAREHLIQAFLSSTPWKTADRYAMAADASGRSYERLTMGSETAILMNAPYEAGEDVRPFIAVTKMLTEAGLNPPNLIAEDVKNGFLLLQDLGDDLFAKICAGDTTQEHELYSAAIDVLAQLHSNPAPTELSPYDGAVYLREAQLLTQWYLPAIQGELAPTLISDFDQIAQRTFVQIPNDNPVLVMRDYHAENLLWLPNAEGVSRVGLLDYQDALAGHPAYDLVSLLEDARRDTSDELQSDMIDLYLQKTGADESEFRQAYALLGAQRNIKIIGIFARLSLRDGKSHYVDLIPRVWAHLMNDLEHPACAELASWINANVPAPNVENMKKLVRSK